MSRVEGKAVSFPEERVAFEVVDGRGSSWVGEGCFSEGGQVGEQSQG